MAIKKKTINYSPSTINFRVKHAFTLIELLVVITISAMVMGLTTASFLTFERNQKLKNAAATLKNDLRFVQSKAATGDKSTSNCVSSPPIIKPLVGWYLNIGTGDINYTISSDCLGSATGFGLSCAIGGECAQLYKTVSLPSGIAVEQRTDSNGTFGCMAGLLRANILFEPLKTGVIFFAAESAITPPFYGAGNPPTYRYQACAGQDLNIILKDQQSGARWKVTVKSSGDINDAKI